MKIEIKSRWNGSVLFSLETTSLKLAIEAAVRKGAYLKGADLEGAYLKGADLEGAYLKGAYLKGADLKGAYLEGAYLEGADLKGAYLEGAYLKGAKVKLSPDTRLPTGETWKEYLEEVVPALLAAGGRQVTADAWDCHSWSNCPMKQAFHIDNPSKAPAIWRHRVQQFVHFFDAGLIPLPKCVKKIETAETK